MSHFREYLSGAYSVYLYLPLSRAAKSLRDLSRRLRGKSTTHTQHTSLKKAAWNQLIDCAGFRLAELKKSNGNVRVSELGILSLLARQCAEKTSIFEIGTFDGRTTLNLAINSPDSCEIITLDLPPDTETLFDVDSGEKHFINKPESGARYKNTRNHANSCEKIRQKFGDSATFDFSPYYDKCSLIFVDGSHAYNYAISDTRNAMKMTCDGGIIIWHDYGVWEGVTRALEEIEQQDKLGLRHIAGTSLVYLKNTK